MERQENIDDVMVSILGYELDGPRVSSGFKEGDNLFYEKGVSFDLNSEDNVPRGVHSVLCGVLSPIDAMLSITIGLATKNFVLKRGEYLKLNIPVSAIKFNNIFFETVPNTTLDLVWFGGTDILKENYNISVPSVGGDVVEGTFMSLLKFEARESPQKILSESQKCVVRMNRKISYIDIDKLIGTPEKHVYRGGVFSYKNVLYDPYKEDWKKRHPGFYVPNVCDILHKIRVPIDTKLTVERSSRILTGTKRNIVVMSLKKDTPVTLNIPIHAAYYEKIDLILDPPTEYEWQCLFLVPILDLAHLSKMLNIPLYSKNANVSVWQGKYININQYRKI